MRCVCAEGRNSLRLPYGDAVTPSLIEELDPEPGLERRRRYRITRAGRSLIRREAERLERAAAWARNKRLLSRGTR